MARRGSSGMDDGVSNYSNNEERNGAPANGCTPSSVRGSALGNQSTLTPANLGEAKIFHALKDLFDMFDERIAFGTFRAIHSRCIDNGKLPAPHTLWDLLVESNIHTVYVTPAQICSLLAHLGIAVEARSNSESNNEPITPPKKSSEPPCPTSAVETTQPQVPKRCEQTQTAAVSAAPEQRVPEELPPQKKRSPSADRTERPPMKFGAFHHPSASRQSPSPPKTCRLPEQEQLALAAELHHQPIRRRKRDISPSTAKYDAEEDKQCTFAPQINQSSRRMVAKKRSNSREPSVENRTAPGNESFREFTKTWDNKRSSSNTPSVIDSAVSRPTPRRRSFSVTKREDAAPCLDVGRGETVVHGLEKRKDADIADRDENMPLDPQVYTFKPTINPLRRFPRTHAEPGFYETVTRMRRASPNRQSNKFEETLRSSTPTRSTEKLSYNDILALHHKLKEKKTLRKLKQILQDDEVRLKTRSVETPPLPTQTVNFSLTENPVGLTNQSFGAYSTASRRSSNADLRSSFAVAMLNGKASDPHDAFRRTPRRRSVDDAESFDPHENGPRHYAQRLVREYGLDPKALPAVERDLRKLQNSQLQQQFTHASMQKASPDTYSKRGEIMFSLA